MDPVSLFVFFAATKVALLVGMGMIVAAGLKRFEELRREERAAEAARLAAEAEAAPGPAPVEVPEPIRRAA